MLLPRSSPPSRGARLPASPDRIPRDVINAARFSSVVASPASSCGLSPWAPSARAGAGAPTEDVSAWGVSNRLRAMSFSETQPHAVFARALDNSGPPHMTSPVLANLSRSPLPSGSAFATSSLADALEYTGATPPGHSPQIRRTRSVLRPCNPRLPSRASHAPCAVMMPCALRSARV